MTSKQAAKSLVKFSQRRREPRLTHLRVPQIPGGRASTRIRGVNESLIRSKKSAIPLIILQPWVAASAAMAYLTSCRFNPGRYDPAQCETDSPTTCMAVGNRPPLVRIDPVERVDQTSEQAPNLKVDQAESRDPSGDWQD